MILVLVGMKCFQQISHSYTAHRSAECNFLLGFWLENTLALASKKIQRIQKYKI